MDSYKLEFEDENGETHRSVCYFSKTAAEKSASAWEAMGFRNVRVVLAKAPFHDAMNDALNRRAD